MSATPPAPVPVVVTNATDLLPPAPVPPAPVKPGWTTTEWWGQLTVQVIALLTLFHPGMPTEQWTPIAQAVAVLGAAIASGIYSRSRAQVKAGY